VASYYKNNFLVLVVWATLQELVGQPDARPINWMFKSWESL